MLKDTVQKGIPLRHVRIIPVLLLCVGVLVAAGCGAIFGGSNPTPTATAIPPTPTPEIPDLTIFRNFSYPIEGGCLPEGDQLMPNAPREYRNGTHEGVDFYDYDNCVDITVETAVLAAKDGVVLRVDAGYTPLTQAELDAATARIAAGGANDFDVVDLFRGRQVWIDHGKGVVTRYAHLSAVEASLQVGDRIAAGTVIGYAGDSGTPESLSDPGTEVHPHFELRTGDTYLGAGLSPEDTRVLYEQLFEPFP
jgi:murein DD-endopeptidase MepM/ murein hydrolase activator NlpD